jgi:ribosomal protein RSM22 (predicted rRNA methylase)
MSFPQSYIDAIERYVTQKSRKNLSQSFKKLSTGYRSLDCAHLGSSQEDVEAYLIGRLPLTWSVLYYLLDRFSAYLPQKFSVRDYGSGPGTALLALHHLFVEDRFTYLGVEEKVPMIEAAKALARDLELKGEFIHKDVLKASTEPYILAIASYVLNELKSPKTFYAQLLNNHEYVLVIEPGTPDGYKRILALREEAIGQGWSIIAPCPHSAACPLKTPDWCHFYLRVQRPKSLKDIKRGSMGYEDEKYMYLFLSKTKQFPHSGVIVKKPHIVPFKVTLDVCATSGQIETQEIFKKDKEAYKKAKKLDWGDFLN